MAKLTDDELARLTVLTRPQAALLGLWYPCEWNWKMTVAGMDMTAGRKQVLLSLIGKDDGEAATLLARLVAASTAREAVPTAITAGKPIAGLAVYCDGSCNPNPGGKVSYMSAWAVVRVGEVIMTGKEVPPSVWRDTKIPKTVSTAEMWAILKAYEQAAAVITNSHFTVYSDSQFCVEAINNGYKIRKSPHLAVIAKAIHNLRVSMGDRGPLAWIPREQNTLADELSKSRGNGPPLLS